MAATTLPEADQLRCDNYVLCREVTLRLSSQEETYARARVKGWHIFDGFTIGWVEVHWVLGPACVGAHRRGPREPVSQQIPGQEPLF